MQIRHISESRLVTMHPTNHANTAHKIVHTLLAWKKIDHMHTPNNVICEYLYVYILLQIIIHIRVVTETEEVGWVMEGTVCAQDYTF